MSDDASDLLRLQLDALEQDVGRFAGALAAAPVGGRLGVRFEALLQSLRHDLATLERQQAAGGVPAALWSELRLLAADLARFSAEYLRCLQGERLRAAEVDGGFLAVCDALLAGVAWRSDLPLDRDAAVGDGESYAGLTDVVGVRFPAFDVWSLPVALHELGHSVAVRSRDPRPRGGFEDDFAGLAAEHREGLRRSLDGKVDPPALERLLTEAGHHLHEQFADLFALYTGGPAFACTCVLLRFDPGAAYEASSGHPSDAQRTAVLLALLPEIDESYAALAARLSATWGSAVAAAGLEAPPQDGFERQVATGRRVLELLRRNLPARAGYDGWARAFGLAGELVSKTALGAVATAGVRMEDVINAAWLARLRSEKDVRRLERRAFELARRVAGGEQGER